MRINVDINVFILIIRQEVVKTLKSNIIVYVDDYFLTVWFIFCFISIFPVQPFPLQELH
jgi:hypothetical protein